MNELDRYYDRQSEPARSCMLAMRQLIVSYDPEITEAWKYRMPFFCYRRKMFCYLWTDRHTGQPYIGFVDGKKLDHPKLIQGNRARMKIFTLDVTKDLPVRTLRSFLKKILR